MVFHRWQNKQQILFYILYTLNIRGVTTVIILIERTLNDWIIQYNRIRMMTYTPRQSAIQTTSKQQSETKYDPAIYVCKETAENGGLLKEYHCVRKSR